MADFQLAEHYPFYLANRAEAPNAALDQREVDLDDVEGDLAEEAQAGVAGTHVVGGDAQAVLLEQVEGLL